MQECPEILIECNKSQALLSENNATWVNGVNFQLNEGDQISCTGAWLSARDGGDQSLEIINNNDPEGTQDISFNIRFYRTNTAQNFVTFPYMSLGWSNYYGGNTERYYYGFVEPKAYDAMFNNMQTQGIGGTQEPLINEVFVNNAGDPYYNNATGNPNRLYATADSLLNDNIADKYDTDTYTSYDNFLINVTKSGENPRGIREKCGSNTRFTAVYQGTNGRFNIYKQKINAVFKAGYITPDNISTFISESFAQKIRNVVQLGLSETWTSAGRYVDCMYPTALMNVNIATAPNWYYSPELLIYGVQRYLPPTPDPPAPDSTRFSTWNRDCQYQVGLTIDATVQLTNIVATVDNTIAPDQSTNPENIYLLDGYFQPQNDQQYQYWVYMKYVWEKFSGSNSNWYNNNVNEANHMYPNEGSTLYHANHQFYAICVQSSPPGLTDFWNALDNDGNNVSAKCTGFWANWTTPNAPTTFTFTPKGQGGVTNDRGRFNFSGLALTTFQTPTLPVNWTATPADPKPAEFQFQVGQSFNQLIGKQQYYAMFEDPVPPGCPVWVGGSSQGNLANQTLGIPVNGQQYGWACFNMDIADASADDNNPIGRVFPSTNAPGYTFYSANPNNEDPDHLGWKRSFKYSRGNEFVGTTTSNPYRWSLRNEDYPPKTDDPNNDINFQPTFRKFPNFTVAGSKICVNKGGGNDYTFMPRVDPSVGVSILTWNQIDQSESFLTEAEQGSQTFAIGRARLYAKFFQAQVDDGIISVDLGLTTSNASNWQGRQVFRAYIHVCIDIDHEDNPDSTGDYTKGSDRTMREMPQPLVCNIDYESFNDPDLKLIKLDDGRYYCGGVELVDVTGGGSWGVRVHGYSWCYNKFYKGLRVSGESLYGFQYINAVNADFHGNTTPDTPFDNNICDWEIDDSIVRIGMGYSICKNAMFNQTGFGCTTELKDPQDLQYMFDANKNRQSDVASEVDKFNLTLLNGAERGDVKFANRLWIGARNPILSFATDGTSRFFWSQFHEPMRAYNTARQGINVTSSNVIASASMPIKDLTDQNAQGVTIDTTNPPTQITIDLEANQDAGSDVIFYNTIRWDKDVDGLYNFSPELGRHVPMFWSSNNANADNLKINQYCSGNVWSQSFFKDNDLEFTQFFCMDADVRANTFQAQLNTTQRFADNPGTTQTYLSYNRSFPTNTWGSMGGFQGYTNYESKLTPQRGQNGIGCPDPTLVYDVVGGIAFEDFGLYNEKNWEESLWYVMGFDFKDMMPDPYINCVHQRDFTTNILTPQTVDLYAPNAFIPTPRPFTTNAELSTDGFVNDTTNLVGERNYNPVQPKTNLLFTGNYVSETFLSQNLLVLTGGFNGQGSAVVSFYDTNGGSNFINGELYNNNFYQIQTSVPFGTQLYATDTPQKLESPYLFIRSDIVDTAPEFVNAPNGANPGNQSMNVVACIGKLYSAGDFFYSTDLLNANFVASKKRVVTQISIEIVDSNGFPAVSLRDKSAIFFRVVRAKDTIPKIIDTNDLALLEDLMDKKDRDKVEKDMKQLFDNDL